jgi:hypothetical protein
MSDPFDRHTGPNNPWLDSGGAGLPPHTDPTSDPDLAELVATAHRFHRLVDAGERHAAAISPLPTTWEEFMSTPTTASTRSSADIQILPRRVADLVSARPDQSWPKRSSWNTAANLLLAAALILALSAGIWRATGDVNLGFGGGEPNQPTIPFGGFVQQEATPSGAAVDPATLPKAEDCTVEPLTVDEVMAIVKTPDPYVGWTPAESAPHATPGVLAQANSTPAYTLHPGWGPLTQEELDGVSATMHMWYSCQVADSWFQVWALETPAKVQQTLETAFPGLPIEEEIRSTLEDLADGTLVDGPRILTNPAKAESFAMRRDTIDPNPANSFRAGEGQVIAGYASYEPDGTLVQVRPAQDTPEYAGLAGTQATGCTAYVFTLSIDGTKWLLSSQPECG